MTSLRGCNCRRYYLILPFDRMYEGMPGIDFFHVLLHGSKCFQTSAQRAGLETQPTRSRSQNRLFVAGMAMYEAQFCVVSRTPHVKVRPLVVRIGHPFDSVFWGDDGMPSEALALPEPFIVETVLSDRKERSEI